MRYTYSAGCRFDEAHQIHASKLNRWKYFEAGEIKSGVLTWSSRGTKTGSISIRTNLKVTPPYIELDYTSSATPINYKVLLTRVKSNLGRGSIWYFVCPMTAKRCRILYGIGQGFFHRESYKKCYYEKQTYSRKWRTMSNRADTIFGAETAYSKIHKKYFKKFYAGKPTKHYLKLLKQIELSERVPPGTEERLLIC